MSALNAPGNLHTQNAEGAPRPSAFSVAYSLGKGIRGRRAVTLQDTNLPLPPVPFGCGLLFRIFRKESVC